MELFFWIYNLIGFLHKIASCNVWQLVIMLFKKAYGDNTTKCIVMILTNNNIMMKLMTYM